MKFIPLLNPWTYLIGMLYMSNIFTFITFVSPQINLAREYDMDTGLSGSAECVITVTDVGGLADSGIRLLSIRTFLQSGCVLHDNTWSQHLRCDGLSVYKISNYWKSNVGFRITLLFNDVWYQAQRQLACNIFLLCHFNSLVYSLVRTYIRFLCVWTRLTKDDDVFLWQLQRTPLESQIIGFVYTV